MLNLTYMVISLPGPERSLPPNPIGPRWTRSIPRLTYMVIVMINWSRQYGSPTGGVSYSIGGAAAPPTLVSATPIFYRC